ncbi:hypothetical protein DNTS_014667 [Danionella cerebrum]|uniref:Uncharacterized protein n=1 Tax=Danionella cerebrum TaxID=2873325 RepID=A0A553Q1X1_9TELE|nr:hypothetical protein DNTS_014667 [Danionella translucida]
MPKPADVMLRDHQRHQYEVSRFLRAKPAALGILEILVALSALGLTIWKQYFRLLWSPITFFSTGTLTVSAAYCCKFPMFRPDADLPVNGIVLMTQRHSPPLAQCLGTVMYVMPPVPSERLVSGDPLLEPSAPPPSYDQVFAAYPQSFHPVPSAPPPPYEFEDFQTR